MKRLPIPMLWLRLRLAVASWHPLAVGAGLLLVASIAALAWLAQARNVLDQQQALARRVAALPAGSVKSAHPPSASENLELFYRSLGERRYAEHQVKIMFGLAEKEGLVLRQGEYREIFNVPAGLYAYQITLPVKGAYRAIWEFAMDVLRAVPFASLDDVGFRRDAIGDANVEARVRFTLYLADQPAGAKR